MAASPALRVLILGAAAGGGLPQWNCGCANCAAARGGELDPQTQSSVAVSLDGERWALLDASPDIGRQLMANRQLHPRALRGSPVAGVIVTNGDVDHVAGLLSLRERQAYRLFVTAATASILDANPIFRVLSPDCVRRETVRLDRAFLLLPGLEATLFPVPGKVPLFMEEGEPELRRVGEETVGVELRADGKRICYVPGCAGLPAAVLERISGADLLLFDGTLFTDDEMARTGTGEKTGARMGHMAIDGPRGSLAALRLLKAGRKVYVHVNNTNPIWRAGPQRAKVEQAGFEVGYDGMEIVP